MTEDAGKSVWWSPEERKAYFMEAWDKGWTSGFVRGLGCGFLGACALTAFILVVARAA